MGGKVMSVKDRTEKKCSRCGEIKTIEMFHKDSTHLDGRTTACAACRNNRQREINKTPEYKTYASEYGKKRYQLKKKEQ